MLLLWLMTFNQNSDHLMFKIDYFRVKQVERSIGISYEVVNMNKLMLELSQWDSCAILLETDFQTDLFPCNGEGLATCSSPEFPKVWLWF